MRHPRAYVPSRRMRPAETACGLRSAPSRRQPPQTAQEPVHALHALVRPVGVLVGRADEEDVAARGVRAVALHDRRGRDDVAAGLAHLRAVLRDHPLREQRPEGLLEVEVAEVRERLGEEARVHQVQDRVLDPADVLIDRHPLAAAPPGPTRPRRWTRRSSAGSTTRSPRTCPSCPSPGAPDPCTRGSSSAPTPRRPPAASVPCGA